LEAKLAPIGSRLALETIEQMRAGPISGEKQEPALVTKALKLTKEMGLIDWSKSAEQVCRQLRAMQPWPTAYTYLHRADKEPLRAIVYRGQKRDELQLERVINRWGTVIRHLIPASSEKPVGSITVPPLGELWVATGSSSTVQVLELQPAGKKRMSAEEFLRGYPLHPGDRFGPESLT
jgi:methionyl-tRNA formyltransferase